MAGGMGMRGYMGVYGKTLWYKPANALSALALIFLYIQRLGCVVMN
jgi:hypothetical protein